MNIDYDRIYNRLTTQEVNELKHGFPEDKKVINCLKIVCVLSWSVFTMFCCYCLVDEIRQCEDYSNTLALVLTMVGMGILFIIAIKKINRRENIIYKAVQNGEYEVILSKIIKKDYRIVKGGRVSVKVYYYEGAGIRGEIIPCSRKQYKRANVGDHLKVLVIPKLNIQRAL